MQWSHSTPKSPEPFELQNMGVMRRNSGVMSEAICLSFLASHHRALTLTHHFVSPTYRASLTEHAMTDRSLFLRLATALLLTACAIPTAWAATFVIPHMITVDVPTDITIHIDDDVDPELQNSRNTYTVFLAMSPPGWGLSPMCWLLEAVPVDEVELTITIPRDAVPNDTRAKISTGVRYHDDPYRENGLGYSYNFVHILGGNSTWIQRELDGYTTSDFKDVSCMAQACVRRCWDRHYTGNKTHWSDGRGDEEAEACAELCTKALNPSDQNSARGGRQMPFIGALLTSFAVMLTCLS